MGKDGRSGTIYMTTPSNRKPAMHQLKGKKFELNLSAPLHKEYGDVKEIVVQGPYSSIFNEDIEMSDDLLVYNYNMRRLSKGPLTPILPALFGHVNGKPVIVHSSELGKEIK